MEGWLYFHVDYDWWKELYLHSAQPNDPASFDETFMTNNPAQEDYDRPDLASQLYLLLPAATNVYMLTDKL